MIKSANVNASENVVQPLPPNPKIELAAIRNATERGRQLSAAND